MRNTDPVTRARTTAAGADSLPAAGRAATGIDLGRVALYMAGLALLLVLPPLIGRVSGVAVYILNLGLIYAIVALGLNLLVGFAGQFSIGHAGFLAIGAYTSAILTQRYGWHFLFALLAAGALTAVVGFLLGLPALRLSGPYLAVATLGFGVAVPQLIVWRGNFTGGTSGLRNIPAAAIPIWWDPTIGFYNLTVLTTDRAYYYLILAVTIAMTILTVNVVNSHTGRAFVAIRDSELAAMAMGVNLTRYKTTAFAASAFYAGIAGSLYAHLGLRGISPEAFFPQLSIEFLAMVVVGGLGSVRGSLIGALFLTALPEIFARAPVLRENANKNLYIVVFGLLLILSIIFLPRGLASLLERRGRGATGTPTDIAFPDPDAMAADSGTSLGTAADDGRARPAPERVR